VLVNAEQIYDSRWYLRRAIAMANGGGYSFGGTPTAYWPVGYPGFLAAQFYVFGPSEFRAKLVNILLYILTTLLVYVLSKKIFKSEMAARITLAILCFYPNHISYTALLATEIFFTFLLTLGAAALIYANGRATMLALAGVVWGVATLTKPQAVLLPILFLVASYTSVRSFVKSGLLVFAVVGLVVTPWLYRNYVVFGKPLLSTNGGIVLMQSNNPYATGRHVWDSDVRSLLGALAPAPDPTSPEGADNMFDGKEVEREAEARSVAIHYIVNNPLRVARLWPRKLLALYLSDVEGLYFSLGHINIPWDSRHVFYVAVRVVGELYYGVMWMLLGVSLPIIMRNRVRYWYIGVGIIAYFTLVYMVFFGDPRYHFPVMPWVAVYAGVGGELLLTRGWSALTLQRSRMAKVFHNTSPRVLNFFRRRSIPLILRTIEES
jgi:4-amino-4-deoxy-L-arabinose transferase-like glycosyltransferase